MSVISFEGLVKELRIVATKKKTTNKGNPNPEDLFLNNQADPMTKGTIPVSYTHLTLPTICSV